MPSTDSPGEVAALNRRETTYLCAADEHGNLVSFIQSLFTGFGSGTKSRSPTFSRAFSRH